MANMVDDLNLNYAKNKPVYFFCCEEDAASLEYSTTIGCFVRQPLEPIPIEFTANLPHTLVYIVWNTRTGQTEDICTSLYSITSVIFSFNRKSLRFHSPPILFACINSIVASELWCP